ncbi:hypothetical protein H012_gp376 [Acanthamoeba polyphaga moumouvirus]|uniref:Uncharacterized protein n=2 Tax=Moumouvirus TaxID=3080801 RepID=L7RCX4_9VIRU|nr:hypothetical protein H012_gp376 [Acanthamoeba polyphaga moumouvirus]AEX62614.1 hypothetical protein mv_L409 [Moumouvirus Monve]AGC02081.1 hypothetical protein Moumou_00551 [Acanthamoeba polyphaga moumouvirus]AQN68452.1 hypothetical protein [Saudi moumouvirus]
MDPNYNEDLNRQMLALQQQQPAQPIQPAQSSGGFMDYIRNNKLTVFLILLALAALIWWFCFRKPKTVGDVNAAFVPNANTRLNITKNRGVY